MNKKLYLIFLYSLVCLSINVAATITVDDSGGKDYSSIQPAMNAAASGDTVFVYPGT